eukprot:Phypoly_transcript_04516.p1 GENE.Phypoly_transcript_04516~~Phypoly_transcript_04516.p1  ORF type:complete len:687 (+),score=134.99 Phypoly_transcript_04516:103-2163(+)
MAKIVVDSALQTLTFVGGEPFYPKEVVFGNTPQQANYFGSAFFYDFSHTLYINHDKEDLPFQQKEQLLKEKRLNTAYFLQESDLLSNQLLDALRICLMKDLEVYFAESSDSGVINPRNEMQMLATIKKDIQQRQHFLCENLKVSNGSASGFYSAQIKLAEALLTHISDQCQKFCTPANVIPKQITLSTDENSLSTFYEWIIMGGVDYKKVAVADFEGFGRGMAATKQLNEGEIAVMIPRNMIINVETAYADAKLGPIFKEIEGLDDDTILMLYVIYERFNNETSFWKPYFGVLPDIFPTALNFGVTGFLELEGTPLVDELFQARDHLRAFHEMLFPKLSDYYPTIFPEAIFTYENFLWARSLFDSRSIKLKIGEKILPCLIPMADMLNHHPHAQISRGNFSEAKNAFVAYTLCNVPPSAQVFLHYGALPNWQLLLYYGFVVRNNQYDNFHIGFEYSYAEDELLTTKKENLMKKLGLSLEHFLSLNRLSSKVLASLHICLANHDEIDRFEQKSSDLETCRLDLQAAAHTEATVATLMRTLRSLLVAFPKTAKEDLDQLAKSGKASGEFVTQAREAIAQGEGILELYKEEEEGEQKGESGEEKGENEEQKEEDGEPKKEEDGEGKEEETGKGEEKEEENQEMQDEEDEEMSEDMQNIVEYRLGQMLILLHSAKFAHATLEKKRKHSEI